MVNGPISVISNALQGRGKPTTDTLLDPLIQPKNYLGEVVRLSYDEAVVLVNDHHRQQVGGIPGQSFLVATMKRPGDSLSWEKEEASVVLLRVLGPAPLPNETDLMRLRISAAQDATGLLDKGWESRLDAYTRTMLSFAGLRCRVLGTFYTEPDSEGNLVLKFGSDISNYYAVYALKVYKPTDKALEIIANYRDPARLPTHPLKNKRVEVGRIRYASTDRKGQGVNEVRFSLAPTDLLRQKTALFGMTRTGKSNTVKVIASAVFALRYEDPQQGRVGQLVFDINGEYANENVQDRGALKNVWRLHPDGKSEDVVTYGVEKHPNDRDRRLLKINFFDDKTLPIGKHLLDASLARDRDRRYVEGFINASLNPLPADAGKGDKVRYRRRVLAYRALLARAGYDSGKIRPDGKKLFNTALIEAAKSVDEYRWVGNGLKKLNEGAQMSWDQVAEVFEGLHRFMRTDAYKEFNRKYKEEHERDWAEPDLVGILGMFGQKAGVTLVRRCLNLHTTSTVGDYADLIIQDLHQGRLVIVDQSLGDPDLNQDLASRIMRRLFEKHQQMFSEGYSEKKVLPEVLVYIEEAHNLLPSGTEFSSDDPQGVWVRVAKEGAKLHIGMVYATQEVSSVHMSVLKNTANWFIGHLNNEDEIRVLTKFYDFADFKESIRRAQDPGFLRVKVLSNPYVVPVQIDRFKAPSAPEA